MPSQENRRAPRRKHDSVLEIYDDDGRYITGLGRLIDISSVGVRFSTTQVLHKGDRVRARLRLLKEGVLTIVAYVIWTKKLAHTYQYGLHFDVIKRIRKE